MSKTAAIPGRAERSAGTESSARSPALVALMTIAPLGSPAAGLPAPTGRTGISPAGGRDEVAQERVQVRARPLHDPQARAARPKAFDGRSARRPPRAEEHHGRPAELHAELLPDRGREAVAVRVEAPPSRALAQQRVRGSR